MIKANPYIYGKPVINEEMFFGREDVFEFLRKHLIGVYQDNTIMLYGQRRTGKTSILYQILNNRRLGDNYVPVLISLEGLGDAETNAQVFWTVANEIAIQLGIDIPKQKEFDALNNYFRNQFLREKVRPLLNGRKLLLMIDEYEKLEVCVDNPHTKVNPAIFLQFRHLMQHYDWISFIWVGSHNLRELNSEYWKEFTNSIYHTISFLDPKSAKELIERPAAKSSVNYTSDATQRLLEVSGLHPLFLQALCHFAYANSAEKEEITIQDVKTAIGPCIEAIHNLYVSIWQDFRDDEKVILSTTAHMNTRLTNFSVIVGQLDHFKIDWDLPRIKQVMQQLEHKDVLKRNELQQYYYCTPFFKECVKIYQSLETTLEKLNIKWEKSTKFIHEPEIVKAEHNLRIAEEYLQVGEIEKAENTFQYVISNYPDYIDGWLRFGKFYEFQKKWDTAIGLYKKRLKKYPDSIEASNAIGILLKERHNLKEALQQFQVSLDIDNSNNVALANIDEINHLYLFPSYPLPPLRPMQIFQVSYLYSEVPSSKGRLWVVGNDPFLFDYFLPEKWSRNERTRLSLYHDIYHTVSRDAIHLVLKVSKVGQQPDVDPFKHNERKILEHGFNSPFEEVSLALELNSEEIPTIYPRAIYMTGSATKISNFYQDDSRYRSHAELLVPDKQEPILTKHHEYIIIWGYWNGTDEMLANYDGNWYTAVNALSAYRQHFITKATYLTLMEMVRNRMLAVGVEDLNLRGTHILLSLNSANEIVTRADGLPKIRICNFELLRKIGK